MIPEFIRFYQYTLSQSLDELAVSFFALMNSMYRIQAKESLDNILQIATGTNGGKEYIDGLQKQERGISGIVEEVRIIKP